jgi:hypothetical protein
MSLGRRLIVAACVLPLVATAVVITFIAATSEAPPIGFVVVVGVLAFAVSYALGIPAYLLSRSWHVESPVAYVSIGAFVGAIPAVALLVGMPESPVFAAASVTAGAVAGLTLERLLHVGL